MTEERKYTIEEVEKIIFTYEKLLDDKRYYLSDHAPGMTGSIASMVKNNIDLLKSLLPEKTYTKFIFKQLEEKIEEAFKKFSWRE